jgi:hypothetical protein
MGYYDSHDIHMTFLFGEAPGVSSMATFLEYNLRDLRQMHKEWGYGAWCVSKCQLWSRSTYDGRRRSDPSFSQVQLRTAKHDNLDISWSWIFGDKPTSDSDSAGWL